MYKWNKTDLLNLILGVNFDNIPINILDLNSQRECSVINLHWPGHWVGKYRVKVTKIRKFYLFYSIISNLYIYMYNINMSLW